MGVSKMVAEVVLSYSDPATTSRVKIDEECKCFHCAATARFPQRMVKKVSSSRSKLSTSLPR